nr:retrovirus-related Pol polyprotein from transposon TNT 1-94 [Tanacetum cinerariifolium]
MPQQNCVVQRRNRTLVEAARTMLTFANLPSFLWAEAIATACFTQNRSIIHKHFDKTPYELINKRKPNIKFFRVFGCRRYLLNDYEDVGKLKAKGGIRVFVGYSKESAAFRIYNKRTRESSSSSLNDDVQQSPEEIILPSSNTQSITINMVPNGDEASTSHNVFNEDNGTEFKNKTLAKFFDDVGITQQFSAARTPQQNGAEAIATTCFTQNRSIIHKRFDKNPYELMNKRKSNIKFFRVFECICYLLNDYEDVGKLQAKGDIGVFVGYSKESATFRIYKKRTRKIHKSMNVNFDEISEMASK